MGWKRPTDTSTMLVADAAPWAPGVLGRGWIVTDNRLIPVSRDGVRNTTASLARSLPPLQPLLLADEPDYPDMNASRVLLMERQRRTTHLLALAQCTGLRDTQQDALVLGMEGSSYLPSEAERALLGAGVQGLRHQEYTLLGVCDGLGGNAGGMDAAQAAATELLCGEHAYTLWDGMPDAQLELMKREERRLAEGAREASVPELTWRQTLSVGVARWLTQVRLNPERMVDAVARATPSGATTLSAVRMLTSGGGIQGFVLANIGDSLAAAMILDRVTGAHRFAWTLPQTVYDEIAANVYGKATGWRTTEEIEDSLHYGKYALGAAVRRNWRECESLRNSLTSFVGRATAAHRCLLPQMTPVALGPNEDAIVLVSSDGYHDVALQNYRDLGYFVNMPILFAGFLAHLLGDETPMPPQVAEGSRLPYSTYGHGSAWDRKIPEVLLRHSRVTRDNASVGAILIAPSNMDPRHAPVRGWAPPAHTHGNETTGYLPGMENRPATRDVLMRFFSAAVGRVRAFVQKSEIAHSRDISWMIPDLRFPRTPT